MPSTITDTNIWNPTTYPQQIRVLRNPRGLRYYYAIISTNTGIYVYKSPDGSTWSLAGTLFDEASGIFYAVSLDYYDDGSQLIVYVAYGGDFAGCAVWMWYQRLRIPDNVSDPIIGTRQAVVTGSIPDGGYLGATPVIKRDRNGYVHIAFITRTMTTIKGVDYYHGSPRIIGTTTPNPGDAPSWSAIRTIENHPAIAYYSRYARITAVVFGSGDIGGCVWSSRSSGGTIILKGVDIISFNGTTYILGTITTILSGNVSTHTSCDVAFRAVVDTLNYAHLITERTLTNARIQSLKAATTSTVESWEAAITVDNSNNASTSSKITITIDRDASPNMLYAFYAFDTVQTNILRRRTSPTDTISWSSETTVQDNTNALTNLNSCYMQEENGIQIIYTRYISPYTARFYEVITAVPPILRPYGDGLTYILA